MLRLKEIRANERKLEADSDDSRAQSTKKQVLECCDQVGVFSSTTSASAAPSMVQIGKSVDDDASEMTEMSPPKSPQEQQQQVEDDDIDIVGV